MGGTRFIWSEARESLLLTLSGDGVPNERIAQRLGCTLRQVRYRLDALGCGPERAPVEGERGGIHPGWYRDYTGVA